VARFNFVNGATSSCWLIEAHRRSDSSPHLIHHVTTLPGK